MEKWPFLDQYHGLTTLEKCQFLTFWTSCFYCLQRHFFVLEYRKRHFPAIYWLKRKLEKWPFLDQKHGLTPLEKCQFFDFLNFLFLQPRMSFFRSRILWKTFSWPVFPKKKVGEMAIFAQNHGFEKMSIFLTFWTSSFYSLERYFFALQYRKRHFPPVYWTQKNLEKWPFFDQNHGLTLLEKCQFFDFFNFLFL